jgi:hypothetical protein
VTIDPAIDVSAAVLRARRPDDAFFCLEQPERGGFALATLGTAAAIETDGPRRFEDAAAQSRALGSDAERDDPADDPDAPPGSGPVFVGGFAFAPDGGANPEWSSLAPAQIVLPELALARCESQARVTLIAGSGWSKATRRSRPSSSAWSDGWPRSRPERRCRSSTRIR